MGSLNPNSIRETKRKGFLHIPDGRRSYRSAVANARETASDCPWGLNLHSSVCVVVTSSAPRRCTALIEFVLPSSGFLWSCLPGQCIQLSLCIALFTERCG